MPDFHIFTYIKVLLFLASYYGVFFSVFHCVCLNSDNVVMHVKCVSMEVAIRLVGFLPFFKSTRSLFMRYV